MIQYLPSLFSLFSLPGITKKPIQCLEILLTSLAFPTNDAQEADVPLIATAALGGVNNVQIPLIALLRAEKQRSVGSTIHVLVGWGPFITQ